MNILLTGATGYIGRRLEERLPDDPDVRLRLFVRNKNKVREHVRPKAEIVEGHTFDNELLGKAVQDIDTAYYLIHSMRSADFQQLERISAERFLQACVKAGVKRIVYLSGLGRREKAGRHLLSRISTGEILSSQPEKIQTIRFRAGAIIGAGSGTFEILYHLVKRLPVMVTPKWVRLKTQPVAVSDVLKYLVMAKDVSCQENSLVVDIGAETMTVEQMLLQIAEVLGLKRRIIPLPAWIAEISAYWLLLFTPTPYTVAREFIETLKAEPVCQNNNAERYFPEIRLLTFKDAVKQ
ncbi:MAG TPA: NAD(P)H-binding protein, partial [Thermodesulfovibrionia bacterium]|nr:NAD(P)H-binding protein [Thermodesulfovibrionia bacterium]